jgi:predicted HicB family RNase H-like nuclease
MSKKENKKVMSLAIDPELHDALKNYAKTKDTSVSSLVGDIVERIVELSVDDEPMIVAIDPELHNALKEYVKTKGSSISSLLSGIVEKILKLSIDDEPTVVGKPSGDEVLPVMLKIPTNLRGQKDALHAWLETQVNGIVAKLG